MYLSSQQEKQNRCLVSTSSIKCEIRTFHVVVVQRRQSNVEKGDARAKLFSSVLFCHSKPIEFLPFSLPSPSSLVKFPLSSGLCFQTTGVRVGSIDAIYTSFYSGK